MLLTTRRREADDGVAHPRTQSAAGASNSLAGIGRADNDGPAFRRLRVLRGTSRKNYCDWRYAKTRKLVGMLRRIGTEIDAEAIFIGFINGLPVRKVCNDVEVREGESAATFVCSCNGAQCRPVYRRLIVAWEIARNIVPP